jgi:hypothetical protein
MILSLSSRVEDSLVQALNGFGESLNFQTV